MASDHVRVDPGSIRSYASAAQSDFETIRGELTQLIDQVVGVQYSGPNAVSFKTHCGQLASEFSGQLSADLAKIAEAVSAATSSISGALGGAQVTISVNGSAVPAPSVPSSDGTVDVSTTALTDLMPRVSGHIAAINSQLDNHLRSLTSTDWDGVAKDSAVTAVTGFTGKAKTCASDNATAINKYIQDQITAVHAADR